MKNFKKLVSALVVAALLVTVSVGTVYATDYGQPPNYPISRPGLGVSSGDVSNAIEATTTPAAETPAPAEESGSATSDAGSTATGVVPSDPGTSGGAEVAPGVGAAELESGAPLAISAEESVILPLDAIAIIANSPVPVIFDAGSYSISINPADITNNARAIDLHMDVSSGSRQFGDIVANVISIAPATSGNYGFSLTVNIPAARVQAAGLNPQNLKAYHIADDGRITRHPLTVNSDGSVSVKFSGASEYVITEEDLPVDEANPESAFAAGATGATGGAGGGLTASGAPKTGDSQNPFLVAIIGLAALCVAVVMYRYMKKAEKSRG